VLLVDVSKSMGVEDAIPNRLAAAIEAAESMVNALAQEPANRVAVVAFAGRGVLRCPLTENLGAALDALRRLRPGGVRPGGTDLGAALDAARDAFGPEEHAEGRAIVVFSDGEDHPDRWTARLDRLRREDIVVHAVAIGDSDEAHPVPDGTSAQPLLYQGQPVVSRRADAALEAIALATNGSIVRLGLASGDLGALYRARIEPAARRRRESTRIADRAERFPMFLIAAFTFLIAGCWAPRRGSSWRSSWYWQWRWNRKWKWNWRRSVNKAGVAMLLLAMVGLATGAGDSSAPSGSALAAQAVARGRAAYDLGRWDEALAAFDGAAAEAPGSAIPRYDAAATLFQLGRYAEARERYALARDRADEGMRTKIDFALGNTALAEGDVAGAIRSYDECVASTARGGDIETVRRDAAINRQFALEQPQSLAAPQEDRSGDPSKSRNSDRRKRPKRQGADDAPSPDGAPESDSDPGNAGASPKGQDDRDPPGRRRRGGAGGGRNANPETRGDTPEDRLDAALEHIRDAQKRRLPDDEPPMSADDDRKDW
jgi:Ca-activated chloride channel family protein